MIRTSLLVGAVITGAVLAMTPSLARGDQLLVVNSVPSNPSQGNILSYDLTTGAPTGGEPLVPAASGGLNGPSALALGPDGDFYVGNASDSSVLRYSPQGNPLGVFISAGLGGLQGPSSFVFGPDRNLYVASLQTSSILEYDGTNGGFLRTLVSHGSGGLLNPSALIVSDGVLFVAGGGSNDVLTQQF